LGMLPKQTRSLPPSP